MDRRSLVIVGVIFGGLFLALFGFLLIAFIAVRAGGEGGLAIGGDTIGVVEIDGVIVDSDKTLKRLRHLAKEDAIKAVLVRINSPGGSVAPSQEIYSELRKLGEKKKTVCSLGNVAASGGYYIAAGCQKIVASPGTLTGSIGVISQLPYLGDIAEQLKFQLVVIKSGKLKDAGNPFRQLTDEERTYLQSMMDQVHAQFIDAIAQGRGLPREEVVPVADGRILTGEEAAKLKLVDQLGTLNDAIALAASMAGIEGEPKLQYPPEEGRLKLSDFFEEGGRSLARGVKSELLTAAGGAPLVGPAYVEPSLIGR